MVKRMKEIAENEQESKNLNSELQQLEEIQEKLEAKLLGADKEQVCAEDTHTHTCRAQHKTTAAITALTHPSFPFPFLLCTQAKKEEEIRAEAEEKEAIKRRELEEKITEVEQRMRQAVQEAEANEEERRSRERSLQEELQNKEKIMREEEVRTPLSHHPTHTTRT